MNFPQKHEESIFRTAVLQTLRKHVYQSKDSCGHYLFTHKMRPKHEPFFVEEPSKVSSVDTLHSTPKYKSQSIYSIQVDTRLTTLGRMATINLVLVLSLLVDVKRDRKEEKGRFREFDA